MEKLTRRIEEIFSGGRWIIAVQAAAAARRMRDMLADWGSEPLLVAAHEGTGELPAGDIVYTRSGGDSVVDGIRQFFADVESPDPLVQEAVDRFDPGRSARVLAEPFATAPKMVGRRTFGVRRAHWAAWEDKMRVDRLWEELGVAHAPYRIVAPADAPRAARDLETALGTVWVADNSGGWHGGAEFVKWVQGPADHEEMVRWFGDRAREVRVMPFLEGLPASIHGWVTGTGVAVFMPVEILVLLPADRSGFVYAGVSTVWRAPAEATEQMRDVARRVGGALAARDGYRGPFGIDGILTAEGFRPTELNPRMSAGAGVQLASVEVPLGLLMRCEIEGLVDVDHEWLESAAVEQRKPTVHLGKAIEETVEGSLFIGRSAGGGLVELDDPEGSIGKLVAGRSPIGSYLVGEFDVDELGSGDPVGWLAAGALNLATVKWGLGLPELAAAATAR